VQGFHITTSIKTVGHLLTRKHNQIYDFSIDKRRHSNTVHVRYFRAVDFDTDHYLLVAKMREGERE
jgi:hypothetical protein